MYQLIPHMAQKPGNEEGDDDDDSDEETEVS